MKSTILRLLANGYTSTKKYTVDDLIRYFYPLKHLIQKRPDGNIWLNSNNFWKSSNNENRLALIHDIHKAKMHDLRSHYYSIINRFENGDAYGIDKSKGGEVMFKVEFTQGNASEILIETADREQAAAVAVQKQAEFKAEQKKGIISLYEITTEAGTPMRKCYDFWEV